jgi:c-di-AMP phosphodiesterase-like protein
MVLDNIDDVYSGLDDYDVYMINTSTITELDKFNDNYLYFNS